MSLDILTLVVVAVTNLLALSCLLPLLMGRRISASAHDAQISLLLHTLAWIALITSGYWLDPWFSTLSMACMAGSFYMMHRALGGWLGPRPGQRLQAVLCVLMPLGYAIVFSNYQFRVGWANFLLATMMLVVARATLYPAREASRR